MADTNKNLENGIFSDEEEYSQEQVSNYEVSPEENVISLDEIKKMEKEGKNIAVSSKNNSKEIAVTNKNELQAGNYVEVTMNYKENGQKQTATNTFKIIPKDKNGIEEIEVIKHFSSETHPFTDTSLIKANKLQGLSNFPKGVLFSKNLPTIINNRNAAINEMNHNDNIPMIEYDDFSVEIKDVSNDIEKELNNKKQAAKENSTAKTTEKTDEKTEITENNEQETFKYLETPEKLKAFYKNEKEIELTDEQYTQKAYELTKNIYKIPPLERSLVPESEEFLNKLFKRYDNTGNDDIKMKKEFESFFGNPNNKVQTIQLGFLVEQNEIDNNNFRKDMSLYVKNEITENLKAIEENKHPLQQNGTTPPVIINPDENAIWRGNTQIQLQRYNLANNLNERNFVTMHQANNKGAEYLYKPKAILVAHGKDLNGNHCYQILVPCNSLVNKGKKAERQLEKMEKDRRKAVSKQIKVGLKFYEKYGFLPAYDIELSQKNTLPIAKTENINLKNFAPDPKDKNLPPEEMIKKDMDRLMAATMTQTPFVPSVDYKKEPYKQALKDFATNHPEDMIKIANQSYYTVAKEALNQNTNTNTNVQTNTQTNVQTNGPVNTQDEQNVNVNKKTHGRGRK